MIEIHELSKRFGPITALEKVSLRIREGSVTAVVGPNGSGKTTLIKTLLGLTRADSGRMVFKGAVLNGQPEYRRWIGYMPQDPQFPENLRVADVIALVKAVRPSAPTIDKRLIASLGVDRELKKRVNTLSGGARQRLNAALAFYFSPELLILDEPTAGLDPISSRILKDHILEHRRAGRTTIISSHIMSDVEELAGDVVFLCDGRAVFAGTRVELTMSTGAPTLESALIALMQKETL